ncbi:uncharacterized protein [Notamacropus eugenii]|uniref:uncharacterized protein isoform X2 n=1 Tax=Notamacropus eugenii TaxID=9315 RepID=UPI003B67DB21
MQGQEVADLGLGEKGSTGRSFMERFRLLLGLLIKYHTALGYSLLSLLTAGGERLLSSVVFQCPCSATWNLPYSLVFLLAPAWILFLLGFLFSTRAKWLMTGCCARRGGKEKPGKEKPGKEKPVKEENGKEKPGKKEKGKEKPGKEKPGKEENGKEKPEKKEKGKEKPGKEKPGEEEPGEEEPGQEEPGQEEPGQEEPGQEEPGQEEPGEEEPGQEEPGEEEPGEEEPGQEEPGEEEPGQEEPGEEEPGQEEPGEEEPGEEEPGQEEPGEEEPGQEEPRKACRNLGQRCSFTWTALLAPTIWIAVSLLGGGFCECAATGTTWISRRMCPDQEASCLQEVPMAPCQKEKPEKVQEILRELKALSQVPQTILSKERRNIDE